MVRTVIYKNTSCLNILIHAFQHKKCFSWIKFHQNAPRVLAKIWFKKPTLSFFEHLFSFVSQLKKMIDSFENYFSSFFVFRFRFSETEPVAGRRLTDENIRWQKKFAPKTKLFVFVGFLKNRKNLGSSTAKWNCKRFVSAIEKTFKMT